MIRKRYLAAAGLLTLAVVAAGCGKKNDAGSVVQTTPTPTEETSVSPTPTPEMVNMEETVEKNIRWFIENAGAEELEQMGSRGRENLVKNLTREVSVNKYAEEILKL
mgnify:CR=1 FL=1